MTSDRPRSRRFWSCIGRLFFIGFITITLLVLVGFVVESFSSASAQRANPAPGTLVDVGEYKLHVQVLGEDRGHPTVILDAGGGAFSPVWGWVIEELVQHTRVVAYDRPNVGWSENSPDLVDAPQVVNDLYKALQELSVDGPYILVGHSMGGLMVRVFADRYPETVVALVLVDPRDINWEEIYEEGQSDMSPAMFQMINLVSRLGILRLTGAVEQDAGGLPPKYYDQLAAIGPSYQHMNGLHSEQVLGNTATAYLSTSEDLGQVRMIILSATETDGTFNPTQREALNNLHANLAAESEDRTHRFVQGAGHVTIITNQRYASEVSATVLELMQQAAGE
jgi:pimeloyl-ACP methyl ester carboxylesterase